MLKSRDLACCVVAALLLATNAAEAADMIRLGHAQAVEENLWLMNTPGGVTPGRGKNYDVTFIPFRSSSDRFKAYQAGELDCATGASVSLIFAAANGVKLKAVASISKETVERPTSEFWVSDKSSIKSISDLKGKTIAINGYRSTAELETSVALAKAGLNAHRDVRYTVIGFPQMGDALRNGQVDLATIVTPFTYFEQKKGGLHKLFTSRDVLPFNEDLTTVYCSADFIAKHRATVKAFLADFVATTKHYLSDLKSARAALLDAKMVRIDRAIYMDLPDAYRDPDARLSEGDWERLQQSMVEVGFIPHKIDIPSIMDQSLLPPPSGR
jgi:ABC-type nitrate/sulfonate/bicarbonate transport system substrate-binding protein